MRVWLYKLVTPPSELYFDWSKSITADFHLLLNVSMQTVFWILLITGLRFNFIQNLGTCFHIYILVLIGNANILNRPDTHLVYNMYIVRYIQADITSSYFIQTIARLGYCKQHPVCTTTSYVVSHLLSDNKSAALF